MGVIRRGSRPVWKSSSVGIMSNCFVSGMGDWCVRDVRCEGTDCIKGQTCHGCINHDIPVERLCSELLMKLSYIPQAYGYGKNVIPCGGSNPGPSSRESSAIAAKFESTFCYLVFESQIRPKHVGGRGLKVINHAREF